MDSFRFRLSHNVETKLRREIVAAVGRTEELALPYTSNGIHGGVSNLRRNRKRSAKDTSLFVDVLPGGVGGSPVYGRRTATRY